MGALWVMTRRGRAELAIDALDHVEHQDAGAEVERAGRLVAEQQRRALGHGARDGHALLLAARELGGEVVQPVAEADQRQRVLGVERVVGDVGDERHVLARGEAGDEVVELEDEADVLAPVAASARPRRRPSGRRASKKTVPVVGTSRPPRMLSSVDLPLPDAPEQDEELTRARARGRRRRARARRPLPCGRPCEARCRRERRARLPGSRPRSPPPCALSSQDLYLCLLSEPRGRPASPRRSICVVAQSRRREGSGLTASLHRFRGSRARSSTLPRRGERFGGRDGPRARGSPRATRSTRRRATSRARSPRGRSSRTAARR